MLLNIPAPRGRLWRDPDPICPILTSRAKGSFNATAPTCLCEMRSVIAPAVSARARPIETAAL